MKVQWPLEHRLEIEAYSLHVKLQSMALTAIDNGSYSTRLARILKRSETRCYRRTMTVRKAERLPEPSPFERGFLDRYQDRNRRPR